MPDDDVTIREYRPGDGDALRALWSASGFRLVGDDDVGLDRFRTRNPGMFLVGTVDGAIVASAMGAWDGRRGWIYHVATADPHRARGLASRLVERIETVLASHGCPRVNVLVAPGNDAGLAFWAGRDYERRDSTHLGKDLVS